MPGWSEAVRSHSLTFLLFQKGFRYKRTAKIMNVSPCGYERCETDRKRERDWFCFWGGTQTAQEKDESEPKE